MQTSLAIGSVVIKELYRRKDFYVLFVLTALITALLGSLSFFNDQSIARYVKEVCLSLIWISSLIIAVMTAARQIPAERESRTIFPLLAKPVTRMHLLTGKFLGCWLATGLALGLFYLFFTIVSGLREHSWPLASYFQAFWLHWAMLGIVIALTLYGSVIFSAPSANVTIMVIVATAILLLGRHLSKVAAGLPEPANSILYTIYFLIPHLEFFDLRDFIVHGWGEVPWKAWLLATVYAVSYSALFLTAAWMAFRKKALN